MKIVIEMDESEALTVALKEERRQELANAAEEEEALRQLRELNPSPEELMKAFPEENIRLVEDEQRIDDDTDRIMEDVEAGRKSPEEAEPMIDELLQQKEEALQSSDQPDLIMSFRSKKEAMNAGLPRIAQLLIGNATFWAARGISPSDWIAEVLKGHTGDEQAQAAVLAHITKLWSEGPWPWPRA